MLLHSVKPETQIIIGPSSDLSRFSEFHCTREDSLGVKDHASCA